MSTRLEGKVAVITGGTSGIGEATVEVFIEEGAKVVFSGRNDEKGAQIEKALGENAVYHHADVTSETEIESLMKFSVDRFGRIDCLFNNAGASSRGTLETVTQEDFDFSLKVLLGSVVFGIKHVVPIMKNQGSGCIINNSSIAAIRVNQGGYLYSAAKAGVTQLTKVAGVELGPHGIRVNCISPGAIATPIFWGGSSLAKTLPDEENAKKLEKLSRNLASATALQQTGYPKDIAMAALFLASDEGRFVTCQDIVVDGGRTALFFERPRQ
jgi:NAD(P)-dependent dehydrogenase (short-subunit alcohol dehydrogenase family)